MVSYLETNCEFSSDAAFKASKHVRFETSQKSDSVLNFFRSRVFSNPWIHSILQRMLSLITSKAEKTLKPKFLFSLSKGSSTSDIVHIVARSPRFLHRSLDDHIIPSYELIRWILHSDEQTIARAKRCLCLLSSNILETNIKLLLDYGAARSDIARLLSVNSFVFVKNDTRGFGGIKGIGI